MPKESHKKSLSSDSASSSSSAPSMASSSTSTEVTSSSVEITEEKMDRTPLCEIRKKHKGKHKNILAFINYISTFSHGEGSKKSGIYLELMDRRKTLSFVLWDTPDHPSLDGSAGMIIIKKALVCENRGCPFLCNDEETVWELGELKDSKSYKYDEAALASKLRTVSLGEFFMRMVSSVNYVKEACVECKYEVDTDADADCCKNCKATREFRNELFVWKFRFVLVVQRHEVILPNDIAECFFQMKPAELLYWQQHDKETYDTVLNNACNPPKIYKWVIHGTARTSAGKRYEVIEFEDLTFINA